MFEQGSYSPEKKNGGKCVTRHGQRGVDCCLQSGTNYVVFYVSFKGHWDSCEKANDPPSGLQRGIGPHIWLEH